MAPDDREIAIVHLTQEIPQRTINLKEYEFIAFVKHAFNQSKCVSTIMMLVKDTENQGTIKLIMIVIDPWKRIDREMRNLDIPE